MSEYPSCPFYFDENYAVYFIEYRGAFKDEMKKITYACGDTINSTFGVVCVKPEDLPKLLKEVPSILFVDSRNEYVLESLNPSEESNINAVTINPYLNLTGQGVVVGIVDSGIDYLNPSFIYEDDKSKIITIWDQSQKVRNTEFLYVGSVYSNDDINKAISLSKTGGNPYEILPQKDEIGHGTKVAGIIGGRKNVNSFSGVAPQCELAIVKLKESDNFRLNNKKNGVQNVPVYNTSEVIAGIEFLYQFAKSQNKPIVIYLGVGSTDNSHDGNSLVSRYLDQASINSGATIVTSTGNEGDKDGHTSGNVVNTGDSKTFELKISREVNNLNFSIWIKKPNKMSLNIISPSSEQSRFISPKTNQIEHIKFINENCTIDASFFVPENITGNQVIHLSCKDLKPGIWKFQLMGEYITDGRFDAWLPPSIVLPENTKFLNPNPENTLTIPSTTKRIISVGFYNSENNTLSNVSGKGFDINNLVKPDIIAPGINISTTKPGGGASTLSGGSAAAAIVAGASALLLQWAIVDKNNLTLFSSSIKTYFITGAERSSLYAYPNPTEGYGKFDFLGAFNTINGTIKNSYRSYSEYSVNNLFLRIPNHMLEGQNEY